MAKVSVIVPVYNVEDYLDKCLSTLVNQTLQDIEIIVVNDGATDDSQKIIEKYANEYPIVKSYVNENGGLSDARNYGMQYATGEYIGYIDSDDFVELDMYETMYNKAVEGDYDNVECNLRHTYPDAEDIEIGKHIQDKKEMLMFGRSVVWNKIYNREWLEKTKVIFPKGCIYEDVEFFLKLVPHIKRYAYVEPACVHYVQRSSSINNMSSAKTLDILKILDHIYDYYKENGYFEEYEEALEFFFARILLCSSFHRMCGVADRKERKRVLKMNYDKLVSTFPHWKSNPVLKRNDVKNIKFMRSVNGFTYKIYAICLPFIFKMRSKVMSK